MWCHWALSWQYFTWRWLYSRQKTFTRTTLRTLQVLYMNLLKMSNMGCVFHKMSCLSKKGVNSSCNNYCLNFSLLASWTGIYSISRMFGDRKWLSSKSRLKHTETYISIQEGQVWDDMMMRHSILILVRMSHVIYLCIINNNNKSNKSFFLLGQIGYMDHTKPFGSDKDQIFRDIN